MRNNISGAAHVTRDSAANKAHFTAVGNRYRDDSLHCNPLHRFSLHETPLICDMSADALLPLGGGYYDTITRVNKALKRRFKKNVSFVLKIDPY